MAFLKYAKLGIVLTLVLACGKDPIVPFENEKLECTERIEIDSFDTKAIGNGYTIDIPNDDSIFEFELTRPKVIGDTSSAYNFTIIFGVCDVDYISEPPCEDYRYFDVRDSISLPASPTLERTKFGEPVLYDNSIQICSENLILGVAYFQRANDNFYGGILYLKDNTSNKYFLAANFSCRPSFLDFVTEILLSINVE